MTRPGTSGAAPGWSGAAPGPAGPGDPATAAAGQPSSSTRDAKFAGDLESPQDAEFQEDLESPEDAEFPEDADSPEDADPPEDLDPPADLDQPADLDPRDAGDSPGAPGGGIVTAGDRRPGDEHPLSSFAADPRMPIWIRRAVLAAAAGIVAGILLDWRFGLTAAAVVAILDTVHRSRTTAVIPAAVRVTSAQRRTRRRLLWARRSGYLTLNSRAIPGTNCIVDHLVVGPAGVFAVDSERWDRRLPLRATQGGHLYHGPYSQTGRLKHAQLEAGMAAQLISQSLGRKQRIRPAMVIYGPTVPWTVARISGVDVFSGRRLRKYLRAQARARREQRLTHEEIERIHAAAESALPSR